MTHENERKQDEKGKTEHLENYDVEQAIAVVRELGEGLIEATKHVKHHFRREWLEQLTDHYRVRPGKPIIHLDDLDDKVIPHLSSEACELLRPYWTQLVKGHGSEWGSEHFRCVWDIMSGKGTPRWWSSLRVWRKFGELTSMRVNELEPYVVALRAASTGTSRVILRPKLPFNLATPAGAKVIGYRGDATYDTSAFNNKDETLHEDYKRAVTALVGETPFTSYLRESDGYKRTSVGVLVTILTTIGGIDNTVRQKWALNPLPSWFFVLERDSVLAGIRALYDAEGSPTSRGVKLSQAVGVSELPTKLTLPPAKSLGLRVSKLEPQLLDQLHQRPPPLLTSTALLLHQFGVTSFLSLEKVWKTKRDYTAFWLLTIYRMRMMKRYRDIIGFTSTKKSTNLAKFTA